MLKLYSIILCSAALFACSSNGGLLSNSNKNFNSSPEIREQMSYDSARVQQAEREERKELRQERREILMDTANAIKRSKEGGVEVIHYHQLY